MTDAVVRIARTPVLLWLAVALFVALASLPGAVQISSREEAARVSCKAPLVYVIDRSAMGVPLQDDVATIQAGVTCARRARTLLAVGMVGALTLVALVVFLRRRDEPPAGS